LKSFADVDGKNLTFIKCFLSTILPHITLFLFKVTQFS
jgi:hypothetical protein